jgi:hypothetical protein
VSIVPVRAWALQWAALETETLEQTANGAVGCPINLPAHHSFAVCGGSLAGGLDVAEITSSAVELAAERLSTSHARLPSPISNTDATSGVSVSQMGVSKVGWTHARSTYP